MQKNERLNVFGNKCELIILYKIYSRVFWPKCSLDPKHKYHEINYSISDSYNFKEHSASYSIYI